LNQISRLLVGVALGSSTMLAAGAPAPTGGKALNPANDPARQLFAQHCEKCHSGEKHKGDFQIESLTQDFADRKNREMWLAVMEQLEAGKMPPKEKSRPAAQEV